MNTKDNYLSALKKDKENTREYYRKSYEIKTEQQTFLEKILRDKKLSPQNIADVACGGGSLAYNLSKLFNAHFTLIELNPIGLEIAQEYFTTNNVDFINNDIYTLKDIKSNSFDLTICWQTLSWLSNPKKALEELIRVTQKGGSIYISSLFNLNHDVDVYSEVIDKTRASSNDFKYSYNTYSKSTITEWLTAFGITEFSFIPFYINVDLDYNGKGLGSYTIKTKEDVRLQISAGMLLNWAILEIKK